MLALLAVLHPSPSARLYRAIVYHDAAERWIGDSPGSLKYLSAELAATIDAQKKRIDELVGYAPIMAELDNEERQWLKALDRIEFLMWCLDQEAMGNRHASGRLDAVKLQLETTPMPEICRKFILNLSWHRTHDNAVQ